MMETKFKKGDFVALHSLNKFHFNGEDGVLVEFNEAKRRWVVDLTVGRKILVKAENLRLATNEEQLENLEMHEATAKFAKVLKVFKKWEEKPKNKARRKAALKLMLKVDIGALTQKSRCMQDVKSASEVCAFMLTQINPNIPREAEIFLKIFMIITPYAQISQVTALEILKSGVVDSLFSMCAENPFIFAKYGTLVQYFTTHMMGWPQIKNRVKEAPGFDVVRSKLDLSSREIKKRKGERDGLMPQNFSHASVEERQMVRTVLTCNNCLKEERFEGEFSKCARCRMVVYCSKECQIENWEKDHKKECKKLRKKE